MVALLYLTVFPFGVVVFDVALIVSVSKILYSFCMLKPVKCMIADGADPVLYQVVLFLNLHVYGRAHRGFRLLLLHVCDQAFIFVS